MAEIYLCNVCSCQEILRRNGRGQGEWPDHPATIVAEIVMGTTANPDSSQKSCDASSHPHTAEEGGLPGERLWTREHHRG
eukprot:COSAG01_NODE_1473_length_10193_cov_13.155736_3_plen_80_part_00